MITIVPSSVQNAYKWTLVGHAVVFSVSSWWNLYANLRSGVRF